MLEVDCGERGHPQITSSHLDFQLMCLALTSNAHTQHTLVMRGNRFNKMSTIIQGIHPLYCTHSIDKITIISNSYIHSYLMYNSAISNGVSIKVERSQILNSISSVVG